MALNEDCFPEYCKASEDYINMNVTDMRLRNLIELSIVFSSFAVSAYNYG